MRTEGGERSQPARAERMAWVRTRPIAHRCLHDLSAGRPENSLAAAEAACEAGYPVEIDVQLSADNVPVVFHDDRLGRMTDRAGSVADLPAAELVSLRLKGTAEHIPSLAQFLGHIDGRVPILIEIKGMDSRSITLAKSVAALLDDYRGEVAVQAFAPEPLGWFRENRPDICRGQLSWAHRRREGGRGAIERFLLRHLLRSSTSRPDFIGYDVRSLPAVAPAVARRLGLPLLAWTVKSERERKVAARYADNIIFEGFRP